MNRCLSLSCWFAADLILALTISFVAVGMLVLLFDWTLL